LNPSPQHADQTAQTRHDQLRRDAASELRAQDKAAALQHVFYRIAERATAGLSLHDFLQSGHHLLCELMVARNCYVCLHNASTNTLDFPYYVDEQDPIESHTSQVPTRRGLAEFVLRSGVHQLVDSARLQRLIAAGEVTPSGHRAPFCTWLGVPLTTHGRIIGVLAIKSYEQGIIYTESDAQLLSFVSNQIGSAMERYQALNALRTSEERYRSVVENVGVGVVVVQDGYMVFANPSLVRIVGHPLPYLLSQPHTATIHPDDAAEVEERHQRRRRGEPVEPTYSFRVITAQGEVRSLELSAVGIDWNQRPATLMFVVDATARFETEQAQRIAMQRQRELNDMKSRFIATTSHEFRTPLAAIHGSIELLRHYEHRMPSDMKQATLQKIDDAVERMTHMLENILLIGRSEAGQVEFQPRPLRLTHFCQSLVDELRNAMATQLHDIQWQLELPPDDQEFLLDGALIRNIVLNLLSNAVKYSPRGGRVSLCIQTRPDALALVVSDQGIGIPAADQTRLFESFHRASNVGTISGTGLGLFIVKEAVTMHQGSIAVVSGIDQGSTFTVTLPLVIPRPANSPTGARP